MRNGVGNESAAVANGVQADDLAASKEQLDIADATRSLMAALEAACSAVDGGLLKSMPACSPTRDNGLKHVAHEQLTPHIAKIMASPPKPSTWSLGMPQVDPAVCAAGIRQAARDRALAQVRRALHKALGFTQESAKRYVCVFADCEVPHSYFADTKLTPVGAHHSLLRVAKPKIEERQPKPAIFSPCEAAVIPRRNSAQFSFTPSFFTDSLQPEAMDDMYTLDQMILGSEQDTQTLQRWHASQRNEHTTIGASRGRGRRRSGLPIKSEKNKRPATGRRRRPSVPAAEVSEDIPATLCLSPVWDLRCSAWVINWDVNEEPKQHCFFADMECATDRADKKAEADIYCRSIEYAYRRYYQLTSGLESHRINLSTSKELDSPTTEGSTAASSPSPVAGDLRAARRFHRAKYRAVKEEAEERWVDLKFRAFDDLADALSFLQALSQCEALLTNQATIWQETLGGMDLSQGSLPAEPLRFAEPRGLSTADAYHSVLYSSELSQEADDLDRQLMVRPPTPPPDPPPVPVLRIFAPSCPRRLLERLPIRIVSRTASTRKAPIPSRLEDRAAVRKPSPVRSAECRRALANRRLPDGLPSVRTHRGASPRGNRRREGPRTSRRSGRSVSPSPRRRSDRKRWATSPDRRHPPHILPVPVANGPRAPKAARMV